MGKEKKLLVVDDSPTILMMACGRLQEEGYEIVTAVDGDGALSQTKKERPDLIVMDVIMPPPNGYQVCRTLKDDPDYKKIPIILLTAKTSESDKFWGDESGADAYITKPYDPDELAAKVKELLGAAGSAA